MYCVTKLLTTLNPGWQLWLSFDGIKLLPQTAGSIQYQKGGSLAQCWDVGVWYLPCHLYFEGFGRHDISEDFPWLNDWMTIWLLLGNAQKRIPSFTKSIFWAWTMSSGHFIKDVQQVPATTSPTDPCQPHYILRGGQINYLCARSSESTLTSHCRVRR